MSMSAISCFSRVGLVALLIAGCGSSGPRVTEHFDPVTAVTSTRATAPLILYRDESAHAAHARDYVYLGPIEVNRMGSYSYFLWLCIWSTISNEDIAAQRDGFESIVLFVDGEPLSLELLGWTPERIGLSESVYPKPVASAADAYYAVTLDQIRLLAEATDIRLHSGAGGGSTFEPWDSQEQARAGLREFLSRAEP